MTMGCIMKIPAIVFVIALAVAFVLAVTAATLYLTTDPAPTEQSG